MKLVFATGNKNKMREIREIMSGLKLDVLSMKEAGIDIDIAEDADSFEGNALIKARAVFDFIREKKIFGDEQVIVLADDSGLEIDALGGEPGVYSARYMGEDAPYSVKNAEIIRRLKRKKGAERAARFRCVIAAILPDGNEIIADGAFEGLIAEEPAGENGFGYDPILYLPEYGRTAAQIPPEEKNRISHRGKALKSMREKLSRSSISGTFENP